MSSNSVKKRERDLNCKYSLCKCLKFLSLSVASASRMCAMGSRYAQFIVI